MSKKPGRARITGEHFTHRYLWLAAVELRERGRSEEKGNGILIMAAMLFVYLAFEAYLNDVGLRLYPEMWGDEKSTFRTGDYRGTLGKAEYLRSALKLDFARGRRPFQTIVELDRRRDRLVHGHTEVLDREVRFSDPRQLDSVRAEVEGFSDSTFLARAFEDTEAFCDTLQAAAQAVRGHGTIWSPRAFRGMTMHQGGSILESPS